MYIEERLDTIRRALDDLLGVGICAIVDNSFVDNIRVQRTTLMIPTERAELPPGEPHKEEARNGKPSGSNGHHSNGANRDRRNGNGFGNGEGGQ